MYIVSLLETWLGRNCALMHEARRGAVVKGVRGLLDSGKAVLTEIGRHVVAGRYEKHGIKCADRLIGNPLLQAERQWVYTALARWLLGQTNEQRSRRHAREPWLLATSLPVTNWSARRAAGAYEKRMQIEETFRDLKSHR